MTRASQQVSEWMRAARRYPLLSREEEQALALAYRATGDQGAAGRLVTANLRMVVKIALEYARQRVDVLDLVQEGNVGLVQAVTRFEPERGLRLSTYAGFWIRAHILRYLLSSARLVRLGTTQGQRKLFFSLRRVEEELRRAGIAPDASTLAARLGTAEGEVVEMRARLAAEDASLDAPLDTDEGAGTTRVELLAADDATRPDLCVEDEEYRERTRAAVAAFASGLPARDRAILEERWLAEAPATLADLARRFSVTRERIRQLEQRLLARLAAHLGPALAGGVAHVA